jgi:hypothetical protein
MSAQDGRQPSRASGASLFESSLLILFGSYFSHPSAALEKNAPHDRKKFQVGSVSRQMKFVRPRARATGGLIRQFSSAKLRQARSIRSAQPIRMAGDIQTRRQSSGPGSHCASGGTQRFPANHETFFPPAPAALSGRL